jgi:hypothetical protein
MPSSLHHDNEAASEMQHRMMDGEALLVKDNPATIIALQMGDRKIDDLVTVFATLRRHMIGCCHSVPFSSQNNVTSEGKIYYQLDSRYFGK